MLIRPAGFRAIGVGLLLVGLLIGLLAALGSSAVLGAEPSPQPQAKPQDQQLPQGANPTCPVQTDEPSDPAISTEYDGKKVYFCCPKCRRKFLESPGVYLAVLPQFAGTRGAGLGKLAVSGPVSGANLRFPARFVRWIGRFHPVVVHFPIALLLVALMADLGAWFFRSEPLQYASRFCLVMGACGAVVAASLGWCAWLYAIDPGDLAWAMSTHRWLGTTTAGVSVVAALLASSAGPWASPKTRTIQRLFLLACALLVGITGHLGGLLVFGDHPFAW